MKSHREYVRWQSTEDPTFDREFEEAKAELRLAMSLRDARKAAGKTQREVAASMDIAQSAVARYEQGGRTPLATTLLRFCSALNATITFGPNYTVEVSTAMSGENAERTLQSGNLTDAAPRTLEPAAEERNGSGDAHSSSRHAPRVRRRK